jgi:hypothetical protein
VGTDAGFSGKAMGLKPHGHEFESRGGTHHVALEAVAELKAQVGTKLHMYCFILC